METNNYPHWLVPIETAKELKEIGFDLPVQNKTATDVLKSKRYKEENKIWGSEHILKRRSYNANYTDKGISIPTYEQVFEWFRDKGFRITIENHEDSTKILFYNMTISDGKHFKWELPTYEEAREVLVEKLIETYKQDRNGNSI